MSLHYKKASVVGLLGAVAFLFLSAEGCEATHDAPVGPIQNDAPAEIGSMPDGFSNYATKCDHGNRVYTLYHGTETGTGRAGFVVPQDPTCPKPAPVAGR